LCIGNPPLGKEQLKALWLIDDGDDDDDDDDDDSGGSCVVHRHDRIRLVNLIKLCQKGKDIWNVQRIHAYAIKKNLIAEDAYIATALISTYAKCGALHEARQVFERIPIPGVVPWSALISGYAHNKHSHEALKCFSLMRSSGVSPDAVTYASILKACGNGGSLEIVDGILADVRQKGLLDKDVVLGTALVDMYSKCGVLDKAREVFEELPERNIMSWSALITGFSQNGLGDEALKCFEQMQKEGIRPDSVTYASVLKACGIVGALRIGEHIDAEVRKQGLLKKDSVLGTALLDMYFKCNAVEKARKVFELLPSRNVVTWSALIGGYTQNGLGDKALQCFRQMRDAGVCPNVVTYITVLKACGIVGCLEIGVEIDAEVRKQGLLQKEVSLGNALVDMYCKCGAVERAHDVFEELPVRNIVTWNALIAGYTHNGLGHETLNYFRKMKDAGICPNEVTYVCIFKACSILGTLKIGEAIEAEVRKKGLLQKHSMLNNALVDMYSKCGALKKAREMFEQLQERNVVSWTALISGYAEAGLGEEALKCFKSMQNEGVMPNAVTYVATLKACGMMGSVEIGEDLHADIRKHRLLKEDAMVGTALVDMYSKCGAVDKARECFDQLPAQNVMSWSAMISGYVQNGFGDAALECFKEMTDGGVEPNAVTYICILNACGNLGCLNIGEGIHAEVRSRGLLDGNIMLGNALVDMYSKCGASNKALEVFEQLRERNIVTWTALIAGYCQLGCSDVVLYVYNRMRAANIRPNSITFTVLLNACCHAGLVKEGEKLIVEMLDVYRFAPTLEHYTCVVDLFGRAGQFGKVKGVLEKVPDSRRLPLLRSVLASSRKWGNVSLGVWAFEQAVELDDENAAAYVNMANIYAAAAGLQMEAD
jgi:pentatricopeptide repeat protein